MPVIIFFSCFVNFVDFGGRHPDAIPFARVACIFLFEGSVGGEIFSSKSPKAGPPWRFAPGPSLQQIIKRLAQGFRFAGAAVVCFKCSLFVSAGPPHLRQNRSTGQSRKELFCSFGLKKHLSSSCFVAFGLKRKIKCFFSFLKTQKRLSSCNSMRFQRNPGWGTSETNGDCDRAPSSSGG